MIYDGNSASMLLGCLCKEPALLYAPQYPLAREDFAPSKFHQIVFDSIVRLANAGAFEITEVDMDADIEPHKVDYEIALDNNFIEFIPCMKELCTSENYHIYHADVRKCSMLRTLKQNGQDISKYYDEDDMSVLKGWTVKKIMDDIETSNSKVRSRYDIQYVKDEIKAGENVAERLAMFKEKPAFGAMLQSSYLTTIWNGWCTGHLGLRAGASGTGKALPNDTILPTPNGYKRVDEIKVGDYLYDRYGQPTQVLGVFPQGNKEVWQITLEDGRTAKCCDEHLWNCRIGYYFLGQKEKTLSLKEIAQFLNGENIISIPTNNLQLLNKGSLVEFLLLKKIEDLGYETEMTCFLVDNSEHLFLTENYIVTHNTRLALADLVNVGMKEIYDYQANDFIPNPNYQSPTLFINTEQKIDTEVEPMFWAAVSGVEYRKIVNGEYTDEEAKRIIKAGDIIKDSHLHICSMPNFTSASLRRKFKEMADNEGVKYAVFDYMEQQADISQEYKNIHGSAGRQDQVLLSLATDLKQYAEAFDIGILTSQQLNDTWKDAYFVDETALQGGKATKNKIDFGSILIPTTYRREDMSKIKPMLRGRGFGDQQIPLPNLCEFIFKGRYSIYGDMRLKLWSYFDKGTFRRYDYFVTDDANEIVNINPSIIQTTSGDDF